MSCSSLFPQWVRTTDSFPGLLHFGQIFSNVFAHNLQHIGEIQMPQPLMPQFTVIYGCLVAENLRICCETKKAIAIVNSSFSPPISHLPLLSNILHSFLENCTTKSLSQNWLMLTRFALIPSTYKAS
jgi:predicted ATP-grasp superfamily ATP-dependent carboligase